MKKTLLTFFLTLLLAVTSTAQESSDPQRLFPNTAEGAGSHSGTQYEYAVVIDYYTTKKGKSFSEILYSDGRAENTTEMTRATILGKLGAQGWDLVSSDAVQNADSYTYFEKTWLYLRRVKR